MCAKNYQNREMFNKAIAKIQQCKFIASHHHMVLLLYYFNLVALLMTPHCSNETIDTYCGPDTMSEVKSIQISCCVTTIHVISLLSTSNIQNILYYTCRMFTQSHRQTFWSAAAETTHTTNVFTCISENKGRASVSEISACKKFSLNNP